MNFPILLTLGPKHYIQALLSLSTQVWRGPGQQLFSSAIVFSSSEAGLGDLRALREDLTLKSKSLSITYTIKPKFEWHF